MVKNMSAKQEPGVRSQGWEHPLEKEMVTPFQYSCLGNPTDRGAWKAIDHGVAKKVGHDIVSEQQQSSKYQYRSQRTFSKLLFNYPADKYSSFIYFSPNPQNRAVDLKNEQLASALSMGEKKS